VSAPEGIKVCIATTVDDELVGALTALLPQLSSSAPPPTHEALLEIVTSSCTDLLVARDEELGGQIVGSLTLALFRIPTGLRAWIEDVVVDERARGRGVGEALNTFALALARARGAATVDLTSRPTREAANRLYQRIGFAARTTNVYRFTLDEP
jgi:ribosomal protein S18 acetylase RimI-like enzyme